jgi:HK97 family phage portal protein
MDFPEPRPGLLVRLLRAVGLVKVDASTGKADHSAGAEFVPDLAYRSGYDNRAALSAFAAFPWPFSCCEAISSDLASLPLRVYRGHGAAAEPVDNHPVLDLLNQPSLRVDPGLWRRQLYTDLVLSGNAFQLMAGTGDTVTSLIRMHPARVTIAAMNDGQVDHYRHEAGGGHPERFEFDQVLHFRGPSWSDDPSNLWGTGAVQPLHHDLTTEKAQAALAARQATTGQPSGILSPADDLTTWSKQQVQDLRRLYESQMQEGGSGILILGGQASFEKLAWTPREMEWSQVRDFVRQSTLAAFGVVPVRVGIESQNFATAQSQMRLYWGGLQGRAAIIDAGLTRLARTFDPDLSVRHDFSAVDVLQESRTERLQRVQVWSAMGVPLSEAAAYEGFDDLPFTPEDDQEAEQPDQASDPDALADEPEDGTEDQETPATTGEPLAATALNGAQIASLLTILSQVAGGAITFDAALTLIGVAFPTIPEAEAARILAGAQTAPEDDEAEMQRLVRSIEHRTARPPGASWLAEATKGEADAVWRAFVDDVQGPSEKAIKQAVRGYLRGLAARIAERVPNVLAERAVGDGSIVFRIEGDWLADLVDDLNEGRIMDDDLRGAIADSYDRATRAAFAAMPGDLAGDFPYDPARIDQMVDAHLADLAGRRPDGKGGWIITDTGINDGTRAAVRDVVQTGLAEGATVNEIQAAIMASTRISSPMRALRIARTESNRSVNAGGVSAWEQQAEAAGVELVLTWSAAPNARNEHKALNGIERGKDGYWRSGNAKAAHPGGFGVAGLDINCRCHYTPRIIR